MKEKRRRVCKGCGKEFKTTNEKKIFCDTPCRDKYYSDNNGYGNAEDHELFCPVLKEVVPAWFRQEPIPDGTGCIAPASVPGYAVAFEMRFS